MLKKIIPAIVVGVVAIGAIAVYYFFYVMKKVIESKKTTMKKPIESKKTTVSTSYAFDKILNRTTPITVTEMKDDFFEQDSKFDFRIHKDESTGEVTQIDILLCPYPLAEYNDPIVFAEQFWDLEWRQPAKKLLSDNFKITLSDAAGMLRWLLYILKNKNIYGKSVIKVDGKDTIMRMANRKWGFKLVINDSISYLLFSLFEIKE